ncbi:MAG: putative Ig domain-containing protein, partial [Acidimicrobiia bacterium]|nr:putative Ig domain-containing protein [Acidimicrobiia bacterium]
QGAEGDAVSLTLSGSDPDGDALTWSATGLPPGLSMDPATGLISGAISYEACAGSPHTVAVTAADDGVPVLTAGFAFTWTVTDTNRPPEILRPPDQRNDEGAAIALPIVGADPDGDAITWSAAGLPPGPALDPVTGVISGTLSFEAAGTYPVTVTATDDGDPALSSGVTFTWEVEGTNRIPEITSPGSLLNAEGESVSLVVEGYDPDGDTLTWSASGLPPGLSIDPATASIIGSLGFSSAGAYVPTITATDDGSPLLAASVSFTWVVANTNRAPVVVAPADRTDPEGAAVELALAGSDPDGDTLTWSAAGLPPGLSVDPASGVVSGTLGFGVAAGSPYRVTVAAADDGSPSLVAGGNFTWSIGNVDRPPVLGSLPDREGEVGEEVSAALSATDPDGDALTWSATGLPPGVSLAAGTGRLTGTLTGAGAFTVTVAVTAAGARDTGAFSWVVESPGAPSIEPIGNQIGQVGEEASLALVAGHSTGGSLTYSAAGLPPGLSLSAGGGIVSGTPTMPGVFPVTITVKDAEGHSAGASFLWTVVDSADLPPEASNDFVIVGRDELGESGLVVADVLGNDRDPEGAPLTLAEVGTPEVGEVTVVDGAVVFRPPADWLGNVTIIYRVSDPSGLSSEATVTITVRDSLEVLLAASNLQWQPPEAAGVAVPSLGGSGALLGTLVQSLHVLRVPLALLGGAVIWSLLLGGALNVGLALRRGLPAVLSRRGRLMAIVMAAHGAKVPAYRKPGGAEIVFEYLATDARIKATGRRSRAAGREWHEVLTEEGPAWVESVHLTEHLDRAFFAEDRAAEAMLERFVDALRRRGPLADAVSRHGLWVAHHDAPVHYPPERVPAIWDDDEVRVWKGRNPAYPQVRGSFDTAVAAGVLDAYDHPKMELAPDEPAVPSTVIPVEFTNLHFISVGADLLGPERLDQTAWLVHFAYEEGKPRVIALCREG